VPGSLHERPGTRGGETIMMRTGCAYIHELERIRIFLKYITYVNIFIKTYNHVYLIKSLP
jgi:hypothetical protein